MDNQTVCPNCHESDKGCVQYGCWKRTPSTREEALQRKIADLEFHMRTGTLCPNLDVERGVRAVLDEVKRLRTDLQAMTVDRNLWQDAHDDDCPNKSENTALKAQIAATTGIIPQETQ